MTELQLFLLSLAVYCTAGLFVTYGLVHMVLATIDPEE